MLTLRLDLILGKKLVIIMIICDLTLFRWHSQDLNKNNLSKHIAQHNVLQCKWNDLKHIITIGNGKKWAQKHEKKNHMRLFSKGNRPSNHFK